MNKCFAVVLIVISLYSCKSKGGANLKYTQSIQDSVRQVVAKCKGIHPDNIESLSVYHFDPNCSFCSATVSEIIQKMNNEKERKQYALFLPITSGLFVLRHNVPELSNKANDSLICFLIDSSHSSIFALNEVINFNYDK